MTNERLSFNYFPFLALFSLGIFVGLIFPDTDQGFQTLFGFSISRNCWNFLSDFLFGS